MCNKRQLISLLGCLQGVGFRPFVYRLARQYELVGEILNTLSGVTIDVQGNAQALERFQKDLQDQKPKRAFISKISVVELPLQDLEEFKIAPSSKGNETQLALLPDCALCKECLEELIDPKNRRYQYPFLHCMSCGPRFSLFLRMPFDRENTSMVDFPMCPSCHHEYNDPANRRFYSQTNCCPACGPTLKLFDAKRKLLATENHTIPAVVDLLKQGKIVALKNTGGFLLLVDATNESAICRLRERKKRPKKPFALLTTLPVAHKIAWIDEIEEELLTSFAAPIVLLKKKDLQLPSVAEMVPSYGVMLAHNALHHLILKDLNCPLIATSGNLSGEPICIEEKEAFHRLGMIADAFLTHNRRIIHRLDDSVLQVVQGRPMVIRRARGMIPYAMDSLDTSCSLFAAGGHLKNSFAFAKQGQIYLSQHMGDLETQAACQSFEREVVSWQSLLNIAPEKGVCDLHPDYFTTQYLHARSIPFSSIQHHKAHVYAGMLDNQMDFPFFSIVWDGTGFGEDQTIWGGEAFIATKEGIERFATLSSFRLAGAEKAVKEPRRALLGIMHSLYGSNTPFLKIFTPEEFQILLIALDKKIHAPLTSSMGRLFDAVSALLGCCFVSSFEGEAALALETLALKAKKTIAPYSFHIDQNNVIKWQPVIEQIMQDQSEGKSVHEIAWAFHSALAELIVILSKRAGFKNVLMTGGCMQNKTLLELVISRLEKEGFVAHWHSQIPPNDGGLAAGQILGMSLSCFNSENLCSERS